MQELPGAPGTARQGRTGTSVPATRGGVATQPRAPGHGRPPAAQRAAGHGRLSAASKAPGYDVPLAITARAPGHDCLSAVPRAPGHGRPLAALSAARHDRPRATLRAPGVDVPLATTARAPGQHRLSAVPPAPDHARSRARHPKAPGHGRPLAALSSAVGHDRPRATPQAPGDDVPLASTAGAPGHHCLRALSIATAPVPAGMRRLRQGLLPRVPANPRTLIYPQSHRFNRHSRESGNPRPPVATGGPQGGYAPATCVAYSQTPTRLLSHPTTHQVHPAIQVPPHPRSCSTACTGLLLRPPSRAPPAPCPSFPRKRESIPSPGAGSGGGLGRGPPTTDRLPLATLWRGGRVLGQSHTTPGTIRVALARQGGEAHHPPPTLTGRAV